MLEATQLITNRSEWLRNNLRAFAMEKGVAQAVDTELLRLRKETLRLEELAVNMKSMTVDATLIWRRLVKAYKRRAEEVKNNGRNKRLTPNDYREAMMRWLERSWKKELRVARPDLSVAQAFEELERENGDGR